MRLLRLGLDGNIISRQFSNEDIPPYAILSHTWSTDEEVTFEDFKAGTMKSKTGWKKILFCSEQAAANGIQYFWVDTCCIDHKNSLELQDAINSMFSWYAKAAACYVYLSDVSVPAYTPDNMSRLNSDLMTTNFKKSRWFTRGWTLQELLAPKSINFYSCEGTRLGDKSGLATTISQITSVPETVLHGEPLSSFPISERRAWMQDRETTEPEDQAYSMMGVLDVHMTIMYGEGRERAWRRLNAETLKVFQDLTSMPERSPCAARGKELTDTHRLLHGHATRSVVVLDGTAGTGKTQLAMKYLIQNSGWYSAIFWVNARDKDSILLCFQGIANQILLDLPWAFKLPALGAPGGLAQTVRSVLAWLELSENSMWLLIFDNLDRQEIPEIEDFFPKSNHGSILITTRSQDFGIGDTIHISELSRIQDRLEVLHTTSNRVKNHGPGNMDEDACTLVQDLGGLPMTLAMAGNYVMNTGATFAEYSLMYRKMQAPKQVQHGSRESCATLASPLLKTIQITFEECQRQSPFPATMMKLWAYFDPQDIWFDLLRCDDSANNHEVLGSMKYFYDLDAAMQVPCALGLVQRTSANEQFGFRGYSLHQIVHCWTVSVLNKDLNHDLARFASQSVATAARRSCQVQGDRGSIHRRLSEEPWYMQRRLFQHIRKSAKLIKDGTIVEDQLGSHLDTFGDLFMVQGKVSEAEDMYNLSLRFVEENAVNPRERHTMSKLGQLYADQGKLSDAEAMFMRVLRAKEMTLGPTDISTFDTINALALVCTDRGKLYEAEVLFARARKGLEQTLGPTHPSTLSTLNNLGDLYMNQGRLADAEKVLIQALRGAEDGQKPDDLCTLNIIHDLGNLYAEQGRLQEAEMKYKRALSGFRKLTNLKQSNTFIALNNLGSVYADQGKLQEAVACFRQTLEWSAGALEADVPLTLDAHNNLGMVLVDLEDLFEAEVHYRHALEGFKILHGPDNIATLDTLANLANLYVRRGMFDEAEELFKQALQGIEKTLGASHTAFLDIVENLASLALERGRLDQAQAMYQEALEGKEKALGPDHISTLAVVNGLGTAYAKQGRLEEAEESYRRALQGRQRALGPEHTSTVNTMALLGKLYHHQGKFLESEKLLMQALHGRETVLGAEHGLTLSLVDDLGKLHADGGKLEQAAYWSARAFEGRKVALGSKHPSTIATAKNLTEFKAEREISQLTETDRKGMMSRIMRKARPTPLPSPPLSVDDDIKISTLKGISYQKQKYLKKRLKDKTLRDD